eukprot:scaffold20040_cov101-Isochrysis_galbana.AAC.2
MPSAASTLRAALACPAPWPVEPRTACARAAAVRAGAARRSREPQAARPSVALGQAAASAPPPVAAAAPAGAPLPRSGASARDRPSSCSHCALEPPIGGCACE